MSPTEIVFGHLLRDAFSFVNRLPKSGVKRGEPKKTPFVCKLDVTTLHFAQTAASYVPCNEVTASSSKIKLATTLIDGKKLAQPPTSWDLINTLSRWVNRNASLNVMDGSSVLSHKWYTTPHCLVPELSCPIPITHSSRRFDS